MLGTRAQAGILDSPLIPYISSDGKYINLRLVGLNRIIGGASLEGMFGVP